MDEQMLPVGTKVMMSVDNEIRLFDGQWVNIVNANDCWEGYTKEEAVHAAVKMAEEAMARNAKDNLWPKKRGT